MMASELCEYKNQFGDECGNPAPFFYVIGDGGRQWRCHDHSDEVPAPVRRAPKTGDPIPGMKEPPFGNVDFGPPPHGPLEEVLQPTPIKEQLAEIARAEAEDERARQPVDWAPVPLTEDEMRPWPSERGQLASSPGGVKFDSQKVRHDLLSPAALDGLSRVLTYGAVKYEAHNWRKGIDWSRVQAALLRHMVAFMAGEDIDPESGLPHIDHVMCNAMFLSEFQKLSTGEDDRWQVGK